MLGSPYVHMALRVATLFIVLVVPGLAEETEVFPLEKSSVVDFLDVPSTDFSPVRWIFQLADYKGADCRLKPFPDVVYPGLHSPTPQYRPETGTGTFNAANWAAWDASDLRDTFCDIFCLGREGFEAPMVILLIESSLSLNGGDAKRHAQGVPVTGARGLRRGHHNYVEFVTNPTNQTSRDPQKSNLNST